jgi:hypothetical protein
MKNCLGGDKMDDQLYSLKSDFYVTLETNDNNLFLSVSVDAVISSLLGKYGLKNYYVTEHREFRSGKKKKGLRVTIIHPHQGGEESLRNVTQLCEVVARDFQTTFRLSSVVLVHSEIAGKLTTEEELPDA